MKLKKKQQQQEKKEKVKEHNKETGSHNNKYFVKYVHACIQTILCQLLAHLLTYCTFSSIKDGHTVHICTRNKRLKTRTCKK